MNKKIILLSGNPSAKNKFLESAKSRAWVWGLNSKDAISKNLNIFGWNSNNEKDESYYKFIDELKEVANKYTDFEENYLTQNIENFLQDEDQTKSYNGKEFDNFLLIIHGVSRDLVNWLKSDYGVFQIYVGESNHTDSQMFDKILDISEFESFFDIFLKEEKQGVF